MTTQFEIAISTCIVLGSSFILIGSYGLIKLPDVMTRLHAPTKATTLGVGGILVASMLFALGSTGKLSIHELLITFFLFGTAPISAHFIARAYLHLTCEDPQRNYRTPAAVAVGACSTSPSRMRRPPPKVKPRLEYTLQRASASGMRRPPPKVKHPTRRPTARIPVAAEYPLAAARGLRLIRGQRRIPVGRPQIQTSDQRDGLGGYNRLRWTDVGRSLPSGTVYDHRVGGGRKTPLVQESGMRKPRPIVRRVFIVLGLLLVSLVVLVIKTMYDAGEFKRLTPHFSGTMEVSHGLVGAEDITIDQERQLAYISADDRRARIRGDAEAVARFIASICPTRWPRATDGSAT